MGDELREVVVGFCGVPSDSESRRDCIIFDDEKLWSPRAAARTVSGLSMSFAMMLGAVRTMACVITINNVMQQLNKLNSHSRWAYDKLSPIYRTNQHDSSPTDPAATKGPQRPCVPLCFRHILNTRIHPVARSD